MSEKETLFQNLLDKSSKSKEELEQLISDKIEELSGLVTEEGAIHIIANEEGITLDTKKPKVEVETKKIEEINEPKVSVSFLCKVIKKYDKVEFNSSNGSKGSVQSVLAGDETGIIRVTFWNDKTENLENVQEGDILSVINAYTRENPNYPGRMDVNFGQYSDLEVNPEGETITLPEFNPQSVDLTKKKISEIEENDRNIQLMGAIIEFDIPRFYLASPKTFKKVLQNDGKFLDKDTNEEIEPIKVPIVNLSIDDGSGTINIVGFRDRAEKLTGLTSKEIIGLSEDIEKYKSFSRKIVGAKVELGGNTSVNNMTGESQYLVNQILNIDFKTVDELANELTQEVVSEKPEDKKKKVDDLEDIDIEEIDIDDDLL